MANDNYTVPSEPLTREEEYLDAIVTNTSGGGGSSKYVVDELNVTTNGTYTGGGGVNAYNPVNVNVPNSYTAEDEGKVVSSGALVGQTSRTVTTPGTFDTTLNNSFTVDIDIPVQEKDVNFYDYDGTVLYSYTAEEFLELTEMPANPTHTGLTSQGWNWTLSDAKTYVTDYGMCDIGQMYITDDGATRVYVSLNSNTLTIYLGFGINGNATVNWGDNSATETVSGSSQGTTIYTPHTYANAGDYVISIKVNSGKMDLRGTNGAGSSLINVTSTDNNIYGNALIQKVECGDKIEFIRDYAFKYCVNMQSLTIPRGHTYITAYILTFSNIKHITLPSTITNIQNYGIDAVYNLETISVPKSVTSTAMDSISSNYKLKRISYYGGQMVSSNNYNVKTVEGFTNISVSNFYSLEYLNIPSSVTSITASNCYNLKSIKFMGSTPPTAPFNSFTGLPITCKIYVPTGTLTDYTTASNYPDPTVYTYIEY
jgi:hypothetical protein